MALPVENQNRSSQDLSRIPTEPDSLVSSRAPTGRQTSIQFQEAPSPSQQRARRSVEADSMSPGGHARAQNGEHSSDSDSIDQEIVPIAGSGSGRNYNTTGASNNQGPNEDSRKPNVSGGASSDNPDEPSWFRRLSEKYGSIELDNKGSTARDHLALERTFLAWLRTSLAFASIGIAITQLFRLNTAISGNNSKVRRLEYSPYMGHTIPAPEEYNEPYIQDDQSVLALLTSPYANAIPEDTAKHLRQIGKPLGATFLGVSIIVLFIGFHRYFESQHWIIRGKFPASRSSVAIVGFMTGALSVACLVVVLAVAGGSFEK